MTRVVNRRWLAFVLVAASASAYLAYTALRQHRPLVPLIHDESSYLLQSRMLANGHLCLPQHPLADFFESFHILVKPVYCSIYFPGTAIFYAPWAWFSCGPWVVSVVIYGLIAGMTYLIASELLGSWGGLLAVLLLVATPLFRAFSVYMLSQGPATLLGLAMIWAWLRWRSAQASRRSAARVSYALLIGACAGWGAVTRPVDALAFAVPVGLTMLIDLRRNATRKQSLGSMALIVGAALPFLVLQATFDHSVTGKAFETPYVLYLEQNQPGSKFGTLSSAPNERPASALPQKQAFFDGLAAMQAEHRWPRIITATAERLAGVIGVSLCSLLLAPLLAAGFLVGITAAPDRRWRTVLAIPPLFFALYLLNPYFLKHYAIPLVPIASMTVVLGVRAIAQLFRTPGRRQVAGVVLTIGVAAVAIASLPEVDRRVRDENSNHEQLDRINSTLSMQVRAPAVVLFRYAPSAGFQEPVYNIDVCWPDDAPVIRAHDLGVRDREIGRYYALRQPWRHFYLYDRGGERLYDLGTAADVAAGRTIAGR